MKSSGRAARAWLLVWLTLGLLAVGCRRPQDDGARPGAASSATPSVVAPGLAAPFDSAASGPSAEAGRPLGASRDRGLFFVVESDSATAYLLGSIHVGNRDLYPLNATIEEAFRLSDTLVMEVHLGPTGQLQAAQQLVAAGSYPSGDSLDRHISPELMRRVRAKMTGLSALLLPPERMRPWFAGLMLVMQELKRLGFDPEQGIDRHFEKRATGQKRILGIETHEEQIALFTGLSEPVQVLMLKEALDELGSLQQTMDQALGAWKRGDGDALGELLLETVRQPEYQRLYKRIYLDRNQRMAKAIEGYLATRGKYFVVLGSGHLIGKRGIVGLLRSKGLRVVQPEAPQPRAPGAATAQP
jgi:uncharacterized protein YbaP (TraB family)